MRPFYNPYSRYETPTSPGISISEVRVAVQKSSLEKASAETMVECCACRGVGMVSPKERARLLLALPHLDGIDLAATELDEVDE